MRKKTSPDISKEVSKKRNKLDKIVYGENHSPNLPRHKSAKKNLSSDESSSSLTPTVEILSPRLEVPSPTPALNIEFRSARSLFAPLEEPNLGLAAMDIDPDEGPDQNYLARLDEQGAALVEQQRLAQVQQEQFALLEQQRLIQVEEERLALLEQQRLAQIEQERLAQIARVFAPLNNVQVVPEPDFLKDRESSVNKKILEELKDHGKFLHKGPQGRCWANYPSHSEVYLQPVKREDVKLFFKSAGSVPAVGSTWVSAIYKRENGEIIPIHIISESVLREVYRLKEYRLKFQAKEIPQLGKLCLIIKVKDEAAKNNFIQRYVDFYNSTKTHFLDHFPIIRICYKEQQAYKLTRELDVQAVLELHRRSTVAKHFQTLHVFINAYENANTLFTANMQRLSQKAEIVNISPDNLDSKRMLCQLTLEDIEEYESYLLLLRNELTRIKGSMEIAKLQAEGAEDFLAHIISDIRKVNGIASGLHDVSEEYRDYLYDLDNLLCLGEFRQNPRQSSTPIEDLLMQKITFWVQKQGVDPEFLQQFESARVLLASMLQHHVLTQELTQGPISLDQKMLLVENMVTALQELARSEANHAFEDGRNYLAVY